MAATLTKRILHRLPFMMAKPHRRWKVSRHARHCSGASTRLQDELSHKPLVVALIKNAAYYLPSFLEYYRSRGFGSFAIMDNDSTDDSREYLSSQRDVSLWKCPLAFKDYHIEMREFLLHRYGKDRWCLLADADEHFDWPYSDRLPLPKLIEYLEHNRYNAVVAHMLDATASEVHPVTGTKQSDAPDLAELQHRYPSLYCHDYKKHPYVFAGLTHRNKVSNPAIPCLYGGLRNTLFQTDDLLTKHPFVHYSPGVRPLVTSSHTVCGARVADFSAVLRHYKIIETFPEVVKLMLESSSAEGMVPYQAYEKGLPQLPQTLRGVNRMHFKQIDQLETLEASGLVHLSVNFKNWAQAIQMG